MWLLLPSLIIFSQFFLEGADFLAIGLRVDIKPKTYMNFSRVYENCKSKLAKRTKLQVIWVLSDCPIFWTPFTFLVDRMAFIWAHDFRSTERECI